MKRIIEITDTAGLEALLGEHVALFCLNYIYSGTLVGVNDDHVELDAAHIVYETGELTTAGFKDAQPLPSGWRVARGAIESYGKWPK